MFKTPPSSPSKKQLAASQLSSPAWSPVPSVRTPIRSRRDFTSPPQAPKIGGRTVNEDLIEALPLQLAIAFDGRACMAVENSESHILELIAAHGLSASFDEPVRHKRYLVTPLELAVTKITRLEPEKARMARIMLQNGANPNALLSRDDSEGQTLLHQVASMLNIEAVSILLEHGANPNSVDDHGRTPLHAACLTIQSWSFFIQKGDDVVEALLDAGADPHQQDVYGCSPRDYVNNNGFSNIWTMMVPISPESTMNIVWTDNGDRTRCPSEASDVCTYSSDSD